MYVHIQIVYLIAKGGGTVDVKNTLCVFSFVTHSGKVFASVDTHTHKTHAHTNINTHTHICMYTYR